ncbi:hypothetical protein G352_18417 [Rhodococcus ruber BKS 20-38]|uniref:Integral membrane protein n=1 Tax=Rhodococcus ruber BKS 20-38 TaxID=1278076 RepID=M2Z3H7_9NOCA|nr:hypothetical protein [Rhodococcus ruber]EME61807.1 hypothetical protein G352_18417 [Rhodococcus ruber BKS 20-38]
MPSRPPVLVAALVLAALGATAVAVAPLLPVVGADAGPIGAASGAAALVSAVAALAVPVGAVSLARRRGPLSAVRAAALLSGAGFVALGAALLDVALFTDALDADRLELFRPVTAAGLSAGPGAGVVLAGHLASVVAGVLGAVAVRQLEAARLPVEERPVGARAATPVAAGVAVAALVTAGALLAPPFVSNDPVLLGSGVLDATAAAALGALVAAVAVVLAATWALVTPSSAAATGVLAGAGLGALAVLGPRLAAGLTGARLAPSPGVAVGVLAAVLLVASAVALPRLVARSDRAAPRLRRAVPPAPAKRHRQAGVAGIVTGIVATVGSLLPVLSVPAGATAPELPAARMLFAAGLLVLALSFWLLLSEFAAPLRPAVAVPAAGVVAAAGAVLQSWVLAAGLPGVGAGPGTWLAGAAIPGAAVTGVLVVLAGAAERDGIDTSVERTAGPVTRAVGAAAALTAGVGVLLPLQPGAGSVLSYPWGYDVWGRAVLAVAVVAAVLVAGRARPARGTALLLGAAASVALYAASWALVRTSEQEPVNGVLTLPAILGVVLLLAAAWLTIREENP